MCISSLPLKGTRDQHIAEGFNCYDDVLDKGDSTAFLTVEQRDILGACIVHPRDFRNTTRGQLDIVGEESGHSLMQTAVSAQVILLNCEERTYNDHQYEGNCMELFYRDIDTHTYTHNQNTYCV